MAERAKRMAPGIGSLNLDANPIGDEADTEDLQGANLYAGAQAAAEKLSAAANDKGEAGAEPMETGPG